MRGLTRLTSTPAASSSAFSAAAAAAAAYSTFSSSGRGGGGGRGRGGGVFPPAPPSRSPGQPSAAESSEDDSFSFAPSSGHGRGSAGPYPLPSSPSLPSFSSFFPSGRGRGAPASPSDPNPNPKQPIFFKRDESPLPPPSSTPSPLPRPDFSASLAGSGRGKPTRPSEPADRPAEVNRHLRKREESAAKRAPEAVSHASGVGRGVGRGGRGARGGRGGAIRGRGRGRFGGRRTGTDEKDIGIYLGNNANGERLEKKLGEEKMKILSQVFEEASLEVLPSPMDDAYLDAVDLNNMIEFEPEYLVEFENPDIDENPPMSLEEALEKCKPFLMKYEGIQSQEEWEEVVKDVMERLPYMKELMDSYCGPDRVTAKEQQEELQRVANTLPQNIPSSVKKFTDRVILSLQSNPGWGFDKKCQFMDKLVWEVNQHYKQN